jgi:H+/Cl- antiporter ClcA
MKTRDLKLCLLSCLLALPAFAAARALLALINFFTNLFYHGLPSFAEAAPQALAWPLALAVPALGGLLVGLMARHGHQGIRGHGIPEAMEQILTNHSRISPRIAWLKPLSAAVAIGSGGPFGAEGPIIATGGAIGSLLGQWLPAGSRDRKVLLASGAAAGMAAIFGTPVSAVLLALELLLFEFSPLAIFAVGLAATLAAALRTTVTGPVAFFAIPNLSDPSGMALAGYALLGLPLGLAAALCNRAVYAVEEAFERLRLHWMWWPLLGGLAVGALGLVEPKSLGVGYGNISGALSGAIAGKALLVLILVKFISWSLALGSGTSGGTLAPLLTLGAGLGALLTSLLAALMPDLGLDPRLGALAGMSALFAGASGAVLASVAFAFESTRQVPGVLPLLTSSLIASALARYVLPHSIMTARLHQRGIKVPHSWGAPIHD